MKINSTQFKPGLKLKIQTRKTECFDLRSKEQYLSALTSYAITDEKLIFHH